MKYILSRLLADFILTLSYIFISYKLMNKKIDLKNVKLIFIIIAITVISVINCEINHKFFSTITIFCVFIVCNKILFNQDFKKTVLSTLFYELLLTFSEIIYALVLVIFFKSTPEQLVNSFIGTLFANVCMSILPLFLIKINIINNIYLFLLKYTEKIHKYQFLYYGIVLIIALSAFPVTVYYNIDIKYLIIFYLVMSVGSFSIVINNFKTQNQYNVVINKYDMALKSLKYQEEMINKEKVANHENKNLLQTIRSMAINKNEEIVKFIDSILENKYNDSDKLLLKMSNIPSGGLRATIYSEIQKIINNKINYELLIDKKLKTVDLIELNTNTIVDICKIISVFIDNAIDETLKIRGGNILIQLYIKDNCLNIKVSNNFTRSINLEEISNAGYTTKGSGHGYGLSLVKNIIDNNKLLENRLEINKNIFSQILIVNYISKKMH